MIQRTRKNPETAMMMSIIPGFGHSYCEETKSAITWMILTILFLVILFPIGIIMWIACAMDAVKVAKHYNDKYGLNYAN